MMQAVDLAAAVLSGAASIAIGLRSGMLKRDIQTKPTAPAHVTLALAVLAAVLGGASLNIWRGAHAGWREVFCYAALALASGVLLVNIARQKRASPDPAGA
jgi:predicted MFS family arabinose efflux permease